LEKLVGQLEQALLTMNRVAARRLLHRSGLSPVEFVESVMVPALDRIGVEWERGDVALSQVYMSGRICEDLMEDSPGCAGPGSGDHPAIAIAVLTDTHLLGKRLVSSVLRAGGFQLLDYGQAALDDLIERTLRDGVRILIVSTLMLSSALQVKELRRRLDAAEAEVKIVVGGAPFRLDPNLWREVGADATSPTASGIVAIVRELAEVLTCRG
jgi:methanogenic corrinoid protein MtbC1